jgi:hypothetical protein
LLQHLEKRDFADHPEVASLARHFEQLRRPAFVCPSG